MIRLRFVLQGLLRRWGSGALTIVVGALSIAGVSLVIWAQSAIPEAVKARIAETDMVVGPKSSGLDLALCCALHLTPAGGLVDARGIEDRLNAPDVRPYIRQQVPIATGDSFGGRRILWTDPGIVAFYGAKLHSGRLWKRPLEVVAGAEAAKALALKVGSTFRSSHGMQDDGEEHDAAYKVTGILAPTGGVLDQVLLADRASIALVHHDSHKHGGEDAQHEQRHNHAGEAETPSRVNAVLVRFSSEIAQASVPQIVNEAEAFSAASPRLELAKLLSLVRPAIDFATVVAALVGVMAGLILALTLVQALNRRARDYALLRFLGMSRRDLAMLSIIEAMVVTHAALAAGCVLMHVGQTLISHRLAQYGLSLSFQMPADLIATLYLSALGISVAGALVPILRIMLSNDDEGLRA